MALNFQLQTYQILTKDDQHLVSFLCYVLPITKGFEKQVGKLFKGGNNSRGKSFDFHKSKCDLSKRNHKFFALFQISNRKVHSEDKWRNIDKMSMHFFLLNQ